MPPPINCSNSGRMSPLPRSNSGRSNSPVSSPLRPGLGIGWQPSEFNINPNGPRRASANPSNSPRGVNPNTIPKRASNPNMTSANGKRSSYHSPFEVNAQSIHFNGGGSNFRSVSTPESSERTIIHLDDHGNFHPFPSFCSCLWSLLITVFFVFHVSASIYADVLSDDEDYDIDDRSTLFDLRFINIPNNWPNYLLCCGAVHVALSFFFWFIPPLIPVLVSFQILFYKLNLSSLENSRRADEDKWSDTFRILNEYFVGMACCYTANRVDGSLWTTDIYIARKRFNQLIWDRWGRGGKTEDSRRRKIPTMRKASFSLFCNLYILSYLVIGLYAGQAKGEWTELLACCGGLHSVLGIFAWFFPPILPLVIGWQCADH